MTGDHRFNDRKPDGSGQSCKGGGLRFDAKARRREEGIKGFVWGVQNIVYIKSTVGSLRSDDVARVTRDDWPFV